MSVTISLSSIALDELPRLAALVSILSRAGDVIALRGDLGAGKTTLARELIAHLQGCPDAEVPSPTFTLLQSYETPRFPVFHYDFYRLMSADEVAELGFDDNVPAGLSLIEWPERAETVLPADRLEIGLALETAPGAPSHTRAITLTGVGNWSPRVGRFEAIRSFLAAHGLADASIAFLQGDASPRRYARVTRISGDRLVLMDAPRMPDGPPIRDGLPYSRIAHLAEDVRPFVAVANALQQAGLSAPEIFDVDLERGLLLIEDLGDRVFGKEISAGMPIAELYLPAVDALLALRRHPAPAALPLPDGTKHDIPPYDRPALAIEVELLTDWYWPAVKGGACPPAERSRFIELFNSLFDRVLIGSAGWVLRDYHSPNLMWLPERTNVARVGMLDFQDAMRGHPAYDLVSLLQDARLDVPADLEARLQAHYKSAAAAVEPAFDDKEFTAAYAILGAQRNTKILGIFARLAVRDGKRAYLAHMPRIWRYLARNLEAPELAPLKQWYDTHFPLAMRERPLDI